MRRTGRAAAEDPRWMRFPFVARVFCGKRERERERGGAFVQGLGISHISAGTNANTNVGTWKCRRFEPASVRNIHIDRGQRGMGGRCDLYVFYRQLLNGTSIYVG